MSEALTPEEINDLADRWYKALDVHAPVEELYAMLLDEGNEMLWPEGPTHGHAEFKGWYDRVTRLFFDEVHTLTKVEPKIDGDSADVEVVVNWQAKTWNPPEPKSKWLGFDAYQTWQVVRSPDTGKAVIKRYAVDNLDPMAGSETLQLLDQELGRRYLDEFILAGQGPEDLFAPDATYTDPQGQTHTIAEACAMVERFNHAVPDRAVDLQEVIAGPEGIALRWTTRGTFVNDGWGVHATGGSFHNYSLAILHVGQDGRLTDTWEVVDFFSFFKQTGALAEVAGA